MSALLSKMATSVLDDTKRKYILFDVLDGVPAPENESEEAHQFRKEIEHDDISLKFRAEELGMENVLLEFSSSGEI